MSCLDTDTCFPLDPCSSSTDCNKGRWACKRGELNFGTDQNSSLSQCDSPVGIVVVFYFTANILLFSAFVLMIILYKIIPIIFCFKHWPCLKKKGGRGGKGGRAPKQNPENKKEVDKKRMSQGGVLA